MSACEKHPKCVWSLSLRNDQSHKKSRICYETRSPNTKKITDSERATGSDEHDSIEESDCIVAFTRHGFATPTETCTVARDPEKGRYCSSLVTRHGITSNY